MKKLYGTQNVINYFSEENEIFIVDEKMDEARHLIKCVFLEVKRKVGNEKAKKLFDKYQKIEGTIFSMWFFPDFLNEFTENISYIDPMNGGVSNQPFIQIKSSILC